MINVVTAIIIKDAWVAKARQKLRAADIAAIFSAIYT